MSEFTVEALRLHDTPEARALWDARNQITLAIDARKAECAPAIAAARAELIRLEHELAMDVAAMQRDADELTRRMRSLQWKVLTI